MTSTVFGVSVTPHWLCHHGVILCLTLLCFKIDDITSLLYFVIFFSDTCGSLQLQWSLVDSPFLTREGGSVDYQARLSVKCSSQCYGCLVSSSLHPLATGHWLSSCSEHRDLRPATRSCSHTTLSRQPGAETECYSSVIAVNEDIISTIQGKNTLIVFSSLRYLFNFQSRINK